MLAGVLDIEIVGEGRPLRAHVRRVQHPAADVRRRARLPARRRPGVRRHHPPRRQAALRVLREHRAAHPDHHPQGLRRGLRRDELEVDRRRPGLRLADRRAGRDGPAGRGRDRLPPRAAAGRRPGRPARRTGRRVHREVRQPVQRRRARLRRRRDRPGRDPPARSSPASACCAPSARSSPAASTATCRSDWLAALARAAGSLRGRAAARGRASCLVRTQAAPRQQSSFVARFGDRRG